MCIKMDKKRQTHDINEQLGDFGLTLWYLGLQEQPCQPVYLSINHSEPDWTITNTEYCRHVLYTEGDPVHDIFFI